MVWHRGGQVYRRLETHIKLIGDDWDGGCNDCLLEHVSHKTVGYKLRVQIIVDLVACTWGHTMSSATCWQRTMSVSLSPSPSLKAHRSTVVNHSPETCSRAKRKRPERVVSHEGSLLHLVAPGTVRVHCQLRVLCLARPRNPRKPCLLMARPVQSRPTESRWSQEQTWRASPEL